MGKIGKLALFAAMLFGLAIGGWRFYLSAPGYYDLDGATFWKYEMSLVERKSFWPYITKYNVYWNGISASFGGRPVASRRWIEFGIWNGSGIQDIKVYEVADGAEMPVYPSKEDACDTGIVQLPSETFVATRLGPCGRSITYVGRYVFAHVKPPKETAEFLRIVVTDNNGNTTDALVPIDRIRK